MYLMNDNILVAGMVADGHMMLLTGMKSEGRRTQSDPSCRRLAQCPTLKSLQV